MAEIEAEGYSTNTPTRDDEWPDIEVEVLVDGADDEELNGWHTVNFNWREEQVTFHSHVLPSEMAVLVAEETYDVFERVLEAAVGHLVDVGFEVTVDT